VSHLFVRIIVRMTALITLGVLVGSVLSEELGFSSPLVCVEVLREVTDFQVTARSIVVNLSPSDAWAEGTQLAAIPPFSSTILTGASVSGSLLLVLAVDETGLGEQAARELAWTDFYGTGDGAPVLLRSPQVEVGEVKLDEGMVLHQPRLAGSVRTFRIKANLWFSPAGTDCGIHNQHDFIEVHTQIAGQGRMQKFLSKDHSSLYEDQLLSPGTTNPVPFCLEQDGTYAYPWHQYKADTNCVWLALEYHRI
jgi:hypothetical protein